MTCNIRKISILYTHTFITITIIYNNNNNNNNNDNNNNNNNNNKCSSYTHDTYTLHNTKKKKILILLSPMRWSMFPSFIPFSLVKKNNNTKMSDI